MSVAFNLVSDTEIICIKIVFAGPIPEIAHAHFAEFDDVPAVDTCSMISAFHFLFEL